MLLPICNMISVWKWIVYLKQIRFQRNPLHATAVWMKPELVCEVSFTEMTTDGIIRHPSFEALRIDKNAEDVRSENEIEDRQAVKSCF
jgi:bifunctional non-homologous end joining protein LigD